MNHFWGLNCPEQLRLSLTRIEQHMAGVYAFIRYKWDLNLNPAFDCSLISQKMARIVNDCPLGAYPGWLKYLNQSPINALP